MNADRTYKEKLADLDRGVGSVVAIVGEAGLGKSRIMAELKKVHDTRPRPRLGWLEGRAISYGQSIPYFPWRGLGRQIVGASEMDDAPTVRDKIDAWIRRLNLRPLDRPFYETMMAVEDESSRLAIAQLSGDAIVSLMVMSSMPARQTMSPAAASAISTRFRPSNA